MPTKLPKYAHWVAERRFLVDAKALPSLDLGTARRIEDLYISEGRLRLRAITELSTGEKTFKLAKKYAPDNPLIGPMANLYLTADEHALLAGLPGARLSKLRYRVGGFTIDVFEGALKGLVTAECAATNRMAALSVEIPDWCLREVTTEIAYTGGALAVAKSPPKD